MKPDDLLDAIGNVDDLCVNRAGEEEKHEDRKSRKILWGTFGSLAACAALALALTLPFARNSGRDIDISKGLTTQEGSSETALEGSQDTLETAVLWDNIWIYYVEGNEINREQEYLPMSPEEIFNAWKEKNGIGDDVPFLRVQIDSNGEVKKPENGTEGVTVYQVGDYFIYNIAVSKNLETYYDTIDRELLLESLRQTMTEHYSMEFDEYHLFLE